MRKTPLGCNKMNFPERARAQTGGDDQWVLKRREFSGFAIVDEKKRPHPWDTYHQFCKSLGGFYI